MNRLIATSLLIALCVIILPTRALAVADNGPLEQNDDHPFHRETARSQIKRHRRFRVQPNTADNPYINHELEPNEFPSRGTPPHPQGYNGHMSGLHPQGNRMGVIPLSTSNINDVGKLGGRLSAGSIAPVMPAATWLDVMTIPGENTSNGSGAMADAEDQENFHGDPEGRAMSRGLPDGSPFNRGEFSRNRPWSENDQGSFPANRSGGIRGQNNGYRPKQPHPQPE